MAGYFGRLQTVFDSGKCGKIGRKDVLVYGGIRRRKRMHILGLEISRRKMTEGRKKNG